MKIPSGGLWSSDKTVLKDLDKNMMDYDIT